MPPINRVWPCNQCPQVLRTRILLRKHTIEEHQQLNSTTINVFPCHLCLQEFNGTLQRRAHEIGFHGTQPDQSATRQAFQCPHCNGHFWRACDRKAHIVKHHLQVIPILPASAAAAAAAAADNNNNPVPGTSNGNIAEIQPQPQQKITYQCPHCESVFVNRSNRDRHIVMQHGHNGAIYDCPLCGTFFQDKDLLQHHIMQHPQDPDYTIAEECFETSCRTFRKVYIPPLPSLELTLGQDYNALSNVLAHEAALKRFAKCSIVVTVEFVKTSLQGDEKFVTVPIRATSFIITTQQVYTVHIEHAHQQINKTIDEFLNNGSGWILNAVFKTDLQMAKCTPLSGSCGWNQLSVGKLTDIQKLQMNGYGNHECFFYAVARYFVGVDDMCSVMTFADENFIMAGIDVPVSVRQVTKFEKMNSHLDMKINILYQEGLEIYPMLASRKEETPKTHHINLLLFQEEVEGELIRHYVCITNLAKLIRKEYDWRKPSKTDKKRRSYQKLRVCPNCLAKFSKDTSLLKHFDLCKENKEQKIVIPTEGDEIKFDKWMHKFEVPLCGFFDFEAVQTKPDWNCISCSEENMDKCYHKSEVESVQKAGTFCIYIFNFLKQIVFKKTYSGDDAAAVFLDTLLNIEHQLFEKLEIYQPLKLTMNEERDFQDAFYCHICETQFGQEDVKVRDHCHLTGVFKGAAHQLCNMQRIVVKKIPLICHNFAGYDSHLVIAALKKDPRINLMKALPRNTEKFRTITINFYNFLDSLSFLDGALADIVEDLVKANHTFQLIDESGICNNEVQKKLLLQKGVYPYEFATSVDQLRAAKELPPHTAFHSKVSNGNISEADYKHAQTVYEEFGCTDMLHYT
jgi:predicted RNA-binding Zn-ribbon protein involved in translation (DUF1610 family)